MIIGISGKIGSGKDTIGAIIQYFTSTYKDKYSFDDWYERVKLYRSEPNSDWQIKKFADKVKECASLILGIPREDFEKIEVKNSELGKEWNRYTYERIIDSNLSVFNHSTIKERDYYEFNKMTVRDFLQQFGTNACREVVHPNFWVNALFSEYKQFTYQEGVDNSNPRFNIIHGDKPFLKKFPNWIVTDVRFPNELESIQKRGGIVIRVNRKIALDNNNQPITSNKSYSEIDILRSQHPSETALDNAKFDYVIDNNSTIEDLIKQVKEILTIEKII